MKQSKFTNHTHSTIFDVCYFKGFFNDNFDYWKFLLNFQSSTVYTKKKKFFFLVSFPKMWSLLQ